MNKSQRVQLAVYSWAHFCVDALSAYFLYMHVSDPLLWIIGYHGIAFGLQPLLGILTDRYPNISWGKLSIVCVLCAFMCTSIPMVGAILMGLGNALFHLEGGYVSLHRHDAQVHHGGVFVSGGALGIGLARYLYAMQLQPSKLMTVLGLVTAILIFLTPVEQEQRTQIVQYNAAEPSSLSWRILLVAMFIRGLAGFLVPMTYWSKTQVIAITAIASFIGKYIGGYLAEKYGCRKTVVLSQVIAVLVPMSLYFPIAPFFIIMINIPMAVTLAAMNDCFPNHTGMAFGLAPLALYISFLLSQIIKLPANWGAIICSLLMCVSAFLLSLVIQMGESGK